MIHAVGLRDVTARRPLFFPAQASVCADSAAMMTAFSYFESVGPFFATLALAAAFC